MGNNIDDGHLNNHSISWDKLSSWRTKSSDDTESTTGSSVSSVSLGAISYASSTIRSLTPRKNKNYWLQSSSQKLNEAGISITPLDTVRYVHGGYSAVAPLMVNDPDWMDLLQVLMPEAHRDVIKIADENSAAKLMKWAEHNPVVAAYGVLQGQPYRRKDSSTDSSSICLQKSNSNSKAYGLWRSESIRGIGSSSRIRTREPNLTAIEWDVFLDPNIVKKVDMAIEEAKKCTELQDSILAEIEVDRQVARLISRMLLAHGSAGQLVAEALGAVPKYNFSRVAQTTRPDISRSHVLSTGIFVDRWLSLFLAALRIGRKALFRKQKGATRNMTAYGDKEDASGVEWERPLLCGLFLCMGMDDPNSKAADHGSNAMAFNLKEIKKILGAPLGVVLDLKSRRVPPRVWARLIDNLRSRGMCVKGIGSFDIKELRSVAEYCSTPVTPMIFFHSAGDLQRACHAKEIKRGDTVYFNAGSLLWQKPSVLEVTEMNCCAPVIYDPEESPSRYVIHPFAHPRASLNLLPPDLGSSTSSIEDYQRYYDLNIGLYIQEFSIGVEALEVLINFVNFNSSVYKLGLAYGGLNGATVGGIHGDGFWNQRYIGRNWDPKSGPTDYLEPVVEDNEIIREAILAGGAIGALYEDDDIANAIQNTTCAIGAVAHENPFDSARLR